MSWHVWRASHCRPWSEVRPGVRILRVPTAMRTARLCGQLQTTKSATMPVNIDLPDSIEILRQADNTLGLPAILLEPANRGRSDCNIPHLEQLTVEFRGVPDRFRDILKSAYPEM